LKSTITVGILCYNEKNLIWSCLQNLLPWADKIIISDGTMHGTISGCELSADELCKPSTDGTLECVNNAANEYSNVFTMHLHNIPIMVEKDVRNIQYSMSDTDYFMIVDCDEIWDTPELKKLTDFLTDLRGKDATIRNFNFFYDGEHYIDQRHKRIFRMIPNRLFYGNNEMAGEEYIEIPDDIFYFHYGFVDKEKVKQRCRLYDTPYYDYCGSWWYKSIYLKYDGTNFDELCAKNGGTFHLFGKKHPGYGNWIINQKAIKHPEHIGHYLRRLGIDASYRSS